ncbi:MAG: hypothetical protein AAGC73_09200 [Verrucomicrobiota bacterium]
MQHPNSLMRLPKKVLANRSLLQCLLLSGIAFLCGFAFIPLQLVGQPVSDPTKLNRETAEAVTALRLAAGAGSGQQLSQSEPDVRISGLVLSKNPSLGRGVVIVVVDDEHFLAVEGQTLRTDDFEFTAEQVDFESVRFRNKRTGAIRVWQGDVLTDFSREDEVVFVDFSSVPLPLAAQALSYVTKEQIAVSRLAQGTDVTLFLPNAKPDQIIEALTLTHQLYPSTIGESEIIRLQTVEEFARGSTSFQEERSQVFTLRFPNARDIALTIRDLFGERVRLSERIDESEEAGEFLTENLEQRLERFDIIADRGQGLGETGQSSGSTTSTSRSSSSTNNRNNRSNSSLQSSQRSGGDDPNVLTQEEIESLEFINPALLEVARNAKADIFVSVIDRLNKLLVRTRDQRTMDEITSLVEELDQPVQMVFLEIRILRVRLDDGLDTGLNWTLLDAGEFTGTGFNPANAVSGDFVFRYLGDDLAARLDLLQEKDKLTLLGQPSLMTANNEVSRIFIGEEVPILTGFSESSTVVTDTSTVNFVTPEYEQEDVGTTILITANINDDDTVELRLLQEESEIIRNGANILANDIDTGELGEVSIDIVSAQTVSGTFIAADQRTFVIGGLISESMQDERSQIPILGDLPFFGRAFRDQTTALAREELILLVTPTIITNPQDGAFSEKIAKDYLEQQSMHPKRGLNSGNLDVFEETDVIVPGEPERDAPQDTIDALFRERYGPAK